MLFRRYAPDKMASEGARAEPVRLAVVACGPRLDETVTMLKSAVLFSRRALHFHIFAEDELHSGFRDAVSSTLCPAGQTIDWSGVERNVRAVERKVMAGFSHGNIHAPLYTRLFRHSWFLSGLKVFTVALFTHG